MDKWLSVELLEELNRFIIDQFGLEFSGSRKKDLERAIKKMAEKFKFKTINECANWLLKEKIEQNERDSLVELLTIGETYFFRDPKMLNIVEKIMIPMILKEKEVKKMRIWSAGCSTGEEPYTIAILLDKIMTRLEGWDVSVLATDINARSLKNLNEGIYREWSFRDVSPEIKKQYFDKDERDNYHLSSSIKKIVSSVCLNLASDEYPSQKYDTYNMDFIFCRNVLMYFSKNKAKEVVLKLTDSLAPNGFLIVSPCEHGNSCFSNLESINLLGMTFYKKPGSKKQNISNVKENEVENFLNEKQKEKHHVNEEIHFKRLDSRSLGHTQNATHLASHPRQNDIIDLTLDKNVETLSREHANTGDLKNAERLCKEAIKKDPLDVKKLYLLALVLCEVENFQDARKIFKNILYLDQGFILAHFNLGCIALKLGRLGEAKKYFENTLMLSKTLSDSDIIPGSEGMTKGSLLEAIDSQRGKLSTKAENQNDG